MARRYEVLRPHFSEFQRRLWLGAEAAELSAGRCRGGGRGDGGRGGHGAPRPEGGRGRGGPDCGVMTLTQKYLDLLTANPHLRGSRIHGGAPSMLAVSDHAPATGGARFMLTHEDDVSLYVPGRGVLWLS